MKRPYDTKLLSRYHEYKPPDIDLLTGLPRKRKLPTKHKKVNHKKTAKPPTTAIKFFIL